MPRHSRPISSYPRKSTLARKEQKKQVTAIAKKAIVRSLEPKASITLLANATAIPIYAAANVALGPITGIAGGSAVNQRDGNKCQMTGFKYRASFIQAAASSTMTIRLVFFWDRQPVIGAPANIGQVFDTTVLVNAYNMPLWGNRRRFKIIYDKIHGNNTATQNNAAAAATLYQDMQKNLTLVKRFKRPVPLSYSSATGSDVVGPHLYMFIASLEANATFNYYHALQVYFKDV